MAVFVGPDGREWVAFCADAAQGWAGQMVEVGDWMTSDDAGRKFVVQADYFRKHYVQKYPRPVDGGDREPDVTPASAA